MDNEMDLRNALNGLMDHCSKADMSDEETLQFIVAFCQATLSGDIGTFYDEDGNELDMRENPIILN